MYHEKRKEYFRSLRALIEVAEKEVSIYEDMTCLPNIERVESQISDVVRLGTEIRVLRYAILADKETE